MFLGTSGVAILNQETRVLFCLATVSFDFLERVSILDTKVGLLKVVDRQGNFFQFSYGSGFGKKKTYGKLFVFHVGTLRTRVGELWAGIKPFCREAVQPCGLRV